MSRTQKQDMGRTARALTRWTNWGFPVTKLPVRSLLVWLDWFAASRARSGAGTSSAPPSRFRRQRAGWFWFRCPQNVWN